jgi:hypothetical protein
MPVRKFKDLQDITDKGILNNCRVEMGIILPPMYDTVLVLKFAGENRLRIFIGGHEHMEEEESEKSDG